ncbi:hypothetical protein AB0A70_19140 [Streptomyces morookaense]|uniref:hypothetical protein n=1 Tax=Streptomyces morookaense TaxID=1970 RepID=UPI0033EBE577
MAGFRDFLARFRPAGAPGAVTGIPADRSAEVTAELQRPLSQLDAAAAEARAVREAAAAEAERIRSRGRQRAEEITERARAEAGRVRREAADAARAAAAVHAAEAAAAGERDAALTRRRAQERLPALADRVVADVLRDIAAYPARPPAPADDPDGGRGRWERDGSPE